MTRSYRVYIAASSAPSEIERVERWAARLTAAGCQVVSTWPRNIKEVGVANPRDATKEQRKEWADTCHDQVTKADTLWLMCPPAGQYTRGAWYELGVACRCGVRVISSGDTKQSIFTALGDEYETDEEAFAYLRAAAGPWLPVVHK